MRGRRRRKKEGMVMGRIKVGRNRVKIRVYVNKDMERKLEDLAEWMEEKEDGIKSKNSDRGEGILMISPRELGEREEE